MRRAEKQMYFHTLAIRLDRMCLIGFTVGYTVTLVVMHVARLYMA